MTTMTLDTAMAGRSFQNEIIRMRTQNGPSPVMACFDFDGTLVPEIYPHSNRFELAKDSPRILMEELSINRGVIPCLSTGCSFGEAVEITKRAFHSRGVPFYGFSSSEHGATIFCPQINDTYSRSVIAGLGYQLKQEDIDGMKISVIVLSKLDTNQIRDRVILPVLGKIPEEYWVTSTCDLINAGRLEQLIEFSGHTSSDFTTRASMRFGSAYVKISTNHPRAEQLANAIQNQATEHEAYAIITKPKENHPYFTVDISPGTEKGEALAVTHKLLSALTGRTESDLPMAFFGNGENDFSAFDYIRQHPAGQGAFLVDQRSGDNEALSKSPKCNATFLKGLSDIDGVREGLKKLELI